MAKKSLTNSRRKKREKCSQMFFAKYADLVQELFRSPGDKSPNTLRALATWTMPTPKSRFILALDQLRETGFGHLLEAAKHSNCSEAFKELLELLLGFLPVDVPEGVFIPSRRSAGAPPKELTMKINADWVARGKPWPLVSKDLDIIAQNFYPKEFARSRPGSKTRKKVRERVRGTIVRSMLQLKSRRIPLRH